MLEIVTLTPENIDDLAKETGRSAEALWERYYSAQPKSARILRGLPKKEE